MRRVLSLVLSIIFLLFSVSGCSGKTEDCIVLKGAYVLNPDAEIEFINEEVGEGKQYFIIVYDINYQGTANQEINPFDDAIELLINDENNYEIDISLYGLLEEFITNAGYSQLSDIDEILGGSESVRMVSAFKVNSNDIKDGNKFELDFEISDDINSVKKIEYTDIKQITLLDEIFDVEDNQEAFQVARSIATRALITKEWLDDDVFLASEFMWVNLLSALKPFGEYSKMSVGATSEVNLKYSTGISSDKIKALNIDDVKIYYPEIVDEVESLINCYDRTPKEKTNDYELLSSIYYDANTAVESIIEYFGFSF